MMIKHWTIQELWVNIKWYNSHKIITPEWHKVVFEEIIAKDFPITNQKSKSWDAAQDKAIPPSTHRQELHQSQTILKAANGTQHITNVP